MPASLNRRDALKSAAASLLSAAAVGAAEPAAKNAFPRWRGFNLQDFFQAFRRGDPRQAGVRDEHLQWIRDWGFDYVRLAMDYWLWIDSDWPETRRLRPEDVRKIDEGTLEQIDKTVDRCRRYGLHVCVNFHRAPGYCINNPEREPFVLWSDPRAEEAFEFHWRLFARRYRDVPAGALSFNLVNEAPAPRDGYMTREDYRRVMMRAAKAIREESPERIIVIDGLRVGKDPVESMIGTGVGQSVHAYWPGQISHYRAGWVDRNSSFPEPTWPIRNPDGSVKIGREDLEQLYAPWAELIRRGVGVHCGECGCYNKTPYPVFLAWFEDVMQILKQHGIGYALWNFRGPFGILDSGREDIPYEDWHGHQLDRRLLRLLQEKY